MKTVVLGLLTALLLSTAFNASPALADAPGTTWTTRTPASDNDWQSVAYGEGLFIASSTTGNVGTRIMSSPDGITWTTRVGMAQNNWWSVAYGGGQFVAVSSGTSSVKRVMTSPDGLTWTLQTTPTPDSAWRSVTYGNGLFVAVATSGLNPGYDFSRWNQLDQSSFSSG